MERNGISKLDLKRLNRSEILKLITRNGPMSRIDIACRLKLTRAAVTIITNEMIEQGVIYEKGEQKAVGEKVSRGRKKIMLDICENYRLSFGVVIDREKIHVGLANLKGQTLDKRSFSYADREISSLAEQIDEQIHDIMEINCLTGSNILGIGVCISENVRGTLKVQDQYPKGNELESALQKMLQIRFADLPVLVDGTTECLALAEILFRSGNLEKPRNMVLIRYGLDVDAAIMLNDRIYRGSHGNMGWFPHLVVDAHGDRCECGKIGCCVTRMSIWGIMEKIKDLYVQGKTPLLYQATGGDINKINFSVENSKSILIDDSVKELYRQALRYLTTALDDILVILDPDQIVLFGFVFEKILDLDMLNEIMEKEHNCSLKGKVFLSGIPDSSIYLAGNALCVQNLFMEKGGFPAMSDN
ncbi:MAG: ROK family transcriptional regulator [Massiliimalia sp.]